MDHNLSMENNKMDGKLSKTGELYASPAVIAPTFSDLQEISRDLGFKCSEDELNVFLKCSSGLLKDYQRLNKIVEEQLPVKYPRCPGHKEENDHAWYWRCDIKGLDDGKLAGKTIAIKDNVAVAGVPMMNGSKVLEGYVPEFDATVVTRILGAGGRITGKANCEDMCASGGSWTSSSGLVRNPYDETRTTGGSSSGCASLVARGEIDMAIGGDQGGSIRMPASWCGIVGLKPTWGLVPYTGAMAVEFTIDHLGPMTRTVEDCALLLEVIAGYDDGRDARQPANITVPEYSSLINTGITGKKIGLLKEGFEISDRSVSELVRTSALQLQDLGAVVEEVSIPLHKDGPKISAAIGVGGLHNGMMTGNGNGYMSKSYYPLSMQEAMARGKNLRPFDLSSTCKMYFTLSEYMHRHYQTKFYAKGQNLSRLLTQTYNNALQQYDVLILPTMRTTAYKIPTEQNSLEEVLDLSLDMNTNTSPFNATGHPALTVNAGFLEGLPVGMMIVGRMFDEVTVLQVAHAYEQIRDNK